MMELLVMKIYKRSIFFSAVIEITIKSSIRVKIFIFTLEAGTGETFEHLNRKTIEQGSLK